MIGKTISHYKILEKLGEGGMGVVYKAEDTRLDRTVALKLLSPHALRSEEDKARFVNEAKSAAALSHSTICHVYEIDETQGHSFIAMECVEGKSLKALIESGPMKPADALELTVQIAEGLQKAHEKGIIHRDIKPANIMVTKEGQAKITDFGLAKSAGATLVTQEGTTLGTVAYMSPEQARGEEVDGRSDIWSLGAMLYEMVSGQRPFKGDYEPAVVYSILNQAQEPLTGLRTGVPVELERTVNKCLEKDRDERYQTAGDLAADLRRLVRVMKESGTDARPAERRAKPTTAGGRPLRPWLWAFAVVAIVILAVALTRSHFMPGREETAGEETAELETAGQAAGEPVAERKMLVVLPFENLGPPEDEYFADGITEEITSRLAALSGLGVISRTSAFHYKDTDKTIRVIGEELGVDYVLEGTVRWEHAEEGESHVRVTPQLIRVSDDTHIWSDRYDRELTNIFAVQSQIAEQVIVQLDVTLLDRERQALESVPTDDMEAYHAYLRGVDLAYRIDHFKEDLYVAVRMFERAVRLDPEFALAYSELSRVHAGIYMDGYDRSQDRLRKAKDAAERAFELSPELPEARLALAYYYYWCLLDYDRAMEEFAVVERTRPNDTWMLKGMGFVSRRKGEHEESLKYLERAIKLDPKDAYCAGELGYAYTILRRHAEAERYYDLSISMVPDQVTAYLNKAWNLFSWKGDAAGALALLSQAPIETGEVIEARCWLSCFAGDYEGALEALEESPDELLNIFRFSLKSEAIGSVLLLMGKEERAGAAFDSARVMLEAELAKRPDDYRVHSSLGAVYARLGRKEDAIREGKRGAELCPVSKDALLCPWTIFDLARIYAMVGEHEAAIEQVEYLLSIPGLVTMKWYELDRVWAPLHDHPGMRRLMELYGSGA